MHNQFEQERQVKQVIARYHREPIEAAQLRRARSNQPHPAITLSSRLRGKLFVLLGASRTPQELPVLMESPPEPADSPVTL